MKTRSIARNCSYLFTATGVVMIHLCGIAGAATEQFWNIDGRGGSGNWGTGPGDKNWNTAVGAASPNHSWPDSGDHVANFNDSIGGTVTIFGTVVAAGVVLGGTPYTLEAGTLVLARDGDGNIPFIDVRGELLTIDAELAGTDGWIKNGSGNLVISGFNTYTGPVQVAGGTLTLGAAGVLSDSGMLALGNGTTLALSSHNETINNFVSNGGTISGTGTLTGSSYTLNDGSLVAANLGSGNLTTNGAVSITGSSAAFNVNVSSGTLTLSGNNLTDTAFLALASGSNLVMDGSDTIATFSSKGGTISGTGTLTADTYILTGNTSVAGHLGTGILTSRGNTSITGTSAAFTVNVVDGRLTLSGSNLADTLLIQLGSRSEISLSGDETAGTLISNGGTVAGTGTLNAATYQLNNGSSIAGRLGDGTISTAGLVSISGSTGTGTLGITSGILNLTGTTAATTVAIGSFATFLHAGSLSATPEISNAGELVMNASDTASTYISNGGTLTGPGTLTAPTYTLNTNSSVEGNLGGGILTSNGTVSISGTSSADFIHINSGTLLNSGILGNVSTQIDIASGAALGAGGTQNFALLTTSGGGTGTWHGTLSNTATVAPGGVATVGALYIDGNFINAAGATLTFDVGATGHDLLSVAGLASFDGTLAIHQFGAGDIPANVPLRLIDASSYAGNFQSIAEDLAGEVLFNPASGEITRLSFAGPSSLLAGTTANQRAIFISLYDDVIDPGITNVTRVGDSFYQFSGGIADVENPELLAALGAAITVNGLDRSLLNRLSPEVYAGFADYAIQATRSRQRAALVAPALAAGAVPPAAPPSAKDAKQGYAAPPRAARAWEVFAAVDYLDGGTSASRNAADYDLSGTALLAGARTSFGDRYRAAGYFAVDEGDIQGSLIDAEAEGWSIGLLGEMLLDPARTSRLLGGLTYGSYSFDGSRGGASATAGGWAPGSAGFRDVDGSAFDAFIGIDAILYRTDRFRLIPAVAVRYSRGTTDSFTERGGETPGLPIALAVDRVKRETLLTEFSLSAEADLTDRLTLRGGIGLHAGLKDDSPGVSARFATGSRPMSVRAHGLSEDLLFINVGAAWKASDSVSVGIGYRAEIRSGAETLNQISLGTSFRF